MHPLAEIAKLFLKLGTISFGGPAAHIANMEHEVVQRRGWLSREHFLDLFGATHLIPGPNAVEMASHIGYRRAGLAGSLVGGLSFTLPAVLISGALAISYVHYGDLPMVEPFLDGIKPVVLAIILTALWRLGKKALSNWQLALIGTGVAAAVLAGSDEVLALLAGSLTGVFLLRWSRPQDKSSTGSGAGKTAGALAAVTIAGAARCARAAPIAAAGAATCVAVPAAFSLWKLGLFFLKVGAVLYGGGYVLVAYLEGGLVGDYGWLTEQELLDAVAIGQLTPGPMLSTATFVGYVVGERAGVGFAGAAVATLGILLPSFFFVAAVNPLIPHLRNSPWASRFLDAVTAASIGLMAAVTVTLARATLLPWHEEQLEVNWRGCLIAAIAAAASLRWKLAPAWLVLGGAAAGGILFGIAAA